MLPASTSNRHLTARRIAIAGLVGLTLLVFFIMSGTVASATPRASFPFVDIAWSAPALFEASTPTGGDMGAHVLLPSILRDELLPDGRILGWSNDWYAGFPVLYFYFPLPSLVIVLLDVLLPYGVAFKLVTVAGLIGLAPAAYALVRAMGFTRRTSAIAGMAGGAFVLMESFSIFGGNIKSTLAGEFAFSWSFTLSVLYLALIVRDVRAGRGFRLLPGIVLALTALAHVVTTALVVLAAVPLLLRGRAVKPVVGSWGFGFLLTAWWAVPFVIRHFGGLTTNMGWDPVRAITGEFVGTARLGAPLADEFIPVLALGMVGLGWTVIQRRAVESLVWLTVLPIVGYFLLPVFNVTVLYNARLLPYWYFGMYVFAGIAVGLGIEAAGRWLPREAFTTGLTAIGVVALFAAFAAPIHDVPGWVRWNYTGYEGKAGYAEYAGLMEAVDRLEPGRVMWELNGDQGRYGTPMALMLIPYWTESHASMEGLYFESSITTPFHFLNGSEVSKSPSNPVRGLQYRALDFDRAVRHLELYGVDYYVSFTVQATERAKQRGLQVVAEAEPWTVFRLPESELVDVATAVPAVYRGSEDFLDVALAWYDDVDGLDQWVVAAGPDWWPSVPAASGPFDLGDPLPGGTVSDVVLDGGRLSFRTDAIGVPHLVKVSYFPNWTAAGAEGPFRAAPSLMVVVPTQEDVVLEFRSTSVEWFGRILTLAGVLILIGVPAVRRWRGRLPA